MAELPLLKPELYRAESSAGPCWLKGGRCRCGHVFFPFQQYGCERCGATRDALSPCELSSDGTLVAAAVVHRHASESRRVPFVVASVKLNAGPLVRTLMAIEPDTPTLKPGTPVSGCLVAVTVANADGEQWDFRFRPVEAQR